MLFRMCLLGFVAGGFSMLPGAVHAQTTRQITGKVTDSTGAALGGVSVLIKGTKRGATTDSTGYFTLAVPASGHAVLNFSLVGFKDQNIALGDRNVLTVALAGGAKDMGEVVVIGYGTRKKVNLTGAVSDISGTEIAKSPVANISNALAGSRARMTRRSLSGGSGRWVIRRR
jgi:hypothetical protein